MIRDEDRQHSRIVGLRAYLQQIAFGSTSLAQAKDLAVVGLRNDDNLSNRQDDRSGDD